MAGHSNWPHRVIDRLPEGKPIARSDAKVVIASAGSEVETDLGGEAWLGSETPTQNVSQLGEVKVHGKC